MRNTFGLYPALGRFFSGTEDLARAGCMGRTRLYYCLHGYKEFSEAEKLAIANAIIVKMLTKEIPRETRGMRAAIRARKDFDAIYRITEEVA